MDIAKVQKLLATKAQYQPQHQFNDLYRYVRNREWLEQARRNILQNGGANTPGIDGVKARDLSDTDWRELIDQTLEELRNGTFCPKPARRVYIPKANGKLRPLGIPIVPSYCTSCNRCLGLAQARVTCLTQACNVCVYIIV
jgi:RNA-directed DNA polymerase